MIKATISPLHEAIFRPYIRRLLKKQFHAIQVIGQEPDFGERSTLLLPNHSTWWDGFFIYALKMEIFKRQTYLMMLEEQLSKNRFFSQVGAYSIERESFRGNFESIKYTRELLGRPEHPFVCVFPQGELLPWGLRPLAYKRGIDLIVRKLETPVNVCQVAFKSEYLDNQRAEVFVQFGNCRIVEPGDRLDITSLEHDHELLLAELKKYIINGEKGRIVLRGKRSINESFEALREKLGLLRGE